jgi:hypothetical protein
MPFRAQLAAQRPGKNRVHLVPRLWCPPRWRIFVRLTFRRQAPGDQSRILVRHSPSLK